MNRAALLACLSTISFQLAAANASNNASQGAEHSTLATGHSVAGGAQVASAVTAVPLIVAGELGTVSG